jgi:hypothetical protein
MEGEDRRGSVFFWKKEEWGRKNNFFKIEGMNSGERLRLIFGYATLVIIAGIAVMIAVGEVKQESSYGLEPILVALTSVAASFCNWAFARTETGKEVGKEVRLNEMKEEHDASRPDSGSGNRAKGA